MPLRVLVVNNEIDTAQLLARFFIERGDTAWTAGDVNQAVNMLDEAQPDLVVVDLHLPGSAWLELLRAIRQQHAQAGIIITNKYPDFQRELLAREQGVRVFLRQPFTARWIEQALSRLREETEPARRDEKPAVKEPAAPRVRFPVRIKITVPYAILALLFAMAGAYVVSQVVLESIRDRYNNQLVTAGKQGTDWMVSEENRLLETLRLVANTSGIADAVQKSDAETVRSIVLPLAVNSSEEIVEVLDAHGTSVVSLRHKVGGDVSDFEYSRGDTLYTGWDFVQPVLARVVEQGRDKYAGYARAPWGDVFYVSGPIYTSDGSLAGVVLVGKKLSSIAREMSQANQADVTLYDIEGEPLASTLFALPDEFYPLNSDQVQEVIANQDASSLVRDVALSNINYSEVLGPWEIRNGKDVGVLGVSMAELFLVRTSRITTTQIFLLVATAFLLVILIGVTLANQITRPLLRVVSASAEVAKGNLEVKVDPNGNDEVAVLAHSFNYMVAGLQEGSIYRDLLGRTVSPEVREQLRQTFTSGNLRLEGQEAVATVLMTDIRGFTTLSERVDPATVFRWLNEYFSQLVPIITSNSGVVNKFDGDAMLAFFGILPRLLNPRQSATAACQSAVDMLRAIEALNVHRIERGEPPLLTGIGINTGVVTAGGLGTSDRLHYTIIGDSVNSTQRMEALTRRLFNVSGAIISHATYVALGESRRLFDLEPLGSHEVKGKSEELLVYRLRPLESPVGEPKAVAAE
jgi:adenylate cyclase